MSYFIILFVIIHLRLASHPRSALFLLDTGTPGTSRLFFKTNALDSKKQFLINRTFQRDVIFRVFSLRLLKTIKCIEILDLSNCKLNSDFSSQPTVEQSTLTYSPVECACTNGEPHSDQPTVEQSIPTHSPVECGCTNNFRLVKL